MSAPSTTPAPRSRYKRLVIEVLRWGIAILGLGYVVYNTNIYDHVLLVDPETGRPAEVVVEDFPDDPSLPVRVRSFEDGRIIVPVPRSELLMRPDRKYATRAADGVRLEVLAVRPLANFEKDPVPTEVMVAASSSARGEWVGPSTLAGGYRVEAEFPLREIGLARMLREADTKYLLLAVGVIPGVYLITGYRWWLLLRGLGVSMGLGRALRINMVGAFYNTFMPGSTGGDVLKAYYAAKNAADRRTAAVLSVIIDRAIGLLALIIMGGICAALQWHIPQCRQVAVAAAVVVAGLTSVTLVFAVTPVRRALGLEWLLGRLPLQEKVEKATDALRSYKRSPALLGIALLMSFPVHATIVVSAMFAGWAFALPLDWTYYWVVVPTVVLAGALPISPQGAGVMEFFAILLTRPQGATVGQAFALTMSIRLVQIVWNLLAGILVLTGGYHAPTQAEQAEMEGEGTETRAGEGTEARRHGGPEGADRATGRA